MIYDRILHKQKVCYLGAGDVIQLTTQINDIEDNSSPVNGRYLNPAECTNKRY